MKVLIVDDERPARAKLARYLRDAPDVEVVGEAADGERAIELCAALRPDVMTLDLVLPGRDGLEVTEHVMAYTPTPILVVSSSENRGRGFRTFATRGLCSCASRSCEPGGRQHGGAVPDRSFALVH